MNYKIFVSHSFSDTSLIEQMEAAFASSDVQVYLASRDKKYGESLPNKIKKEIEKSDAVLAILTSVAIESSSVSLEVGYAIAKEKLVVPMLEEDAHPGVLLQGLEFVKFTREKISDVFVDVQRYFSKLAAEKEKRSRSKKARNTLVTIGLAIAAIALVGVILYTASRKKSS